MNLSIPISAVVSAIAILPFLFIPQDPPHVGGGRPDERPEKQHGGDQRGPARRFESRDQQGPQNDRPGGPPHFQNQRGQDPRGGDDRRMHLLKIRDHLRQQADELLRHADEIDRMVNSPEFNNPRAQNHNDPRNDPGSRPDFNNRGNFNNDGRGNREPRGEMNDRGPRPPFPGGRRGPIDGFGRRPGPGRDGRDEGPPPESNDSRPGPPRFRR